MTTESSDEHPPRFRRTRNLIDYRLQLRITLWFMAVALLTMLFQYAILAATVSNLAAALPNDANTFLTEMSGPLLRTFASSLAIALVLTFAVGVLMTHKIAGPLYRLSRFLESTERGDCPDDVRLRRDDELHDFCALLNRTTAPLRRRADAKDNRHAA
jgi:hypothetical protein